MKNHFTSLFCMVLNNTLTAPETARKGTCHRRPSTRLCSLLSLCGFVMLGAPSAQAANRTWDGGGGDDNWATAANWDAAIATGDSLFFDGTTRLTPNNNTPANNDYNITFNSGAGAFALSGFAIDLISGGFVVNNSANAQAVNHAVRLLGDGTLTSNGGTLTIGGTLSESGTALKTLTVNGAGNVTISGNITADSGDLQLTKAGTGTLALGGANTYTGTTTVIAGTLLANNTTGSATGTGAVNVSANGTLGGTGTITPTGTNGITVNGMVVPGSGIGNLTLNMGSTSGSTLINSGAGFQYELGLAGTDIGSYGVSDLISIAGASASDFAFNGNNINVGGTGGIGFYKLFDTSSNNANTWTGLTVTNSLITAGLTVSNLTSGLSGNLIMGGTGLGGDAGDIYLEVIPEPGAALLGGIGVLLLLRRRRSA